MAEERATRRLRRRWIAVAVLASTGLACWLPLSTYLRAWHDIPANQRPSLLERDGLRALLAMAGAIPGAWLRSFRGPPTDAANEPIPRLDLEIGAAALAQLGAKRDAALESGVLLAGPGDLVPAVLRADGVARHVELRLKGDLVDHLAGGRWSFRVIVKDGTLLGLRRFSLQAPHTRGFQREALFHGYLRNHDVRTPRYFFVELAINGRRLGLMALEEHFAPELLGPSSFANQSVILKLDEDDFWRAWTSLGPWTPDYNNWRSARVDVFQQRSVERSEQRLRLWRVGTGLLRGLQQGRLAPAEALDVERWATLLAACELFGAAHMVSWNNLRFGVDPLLLVLEPIGFDADLRIPAPGTGLVCQGGGHALASALMDDPTLRAAFLRRLRELATELLDDSPAGELAQLRSGERIDLALLRTEYPWVPALDWDALRRRASELAGLDQRSYTSARRPRDQPEPRHPENAAYPSVVHARLVAPGRLELENVLSRPVHIEALHFVPAEVELRRAFGSSAQIRLPYPLAPTRWPEAPRVLEIRFEPPSVGGLPWSIEGRARVDLEARSHAFVSHHSFPALAAPPLRRPSLEETLALHPFLERDPDDPAFLRASPGRHVLGAPLVLPEGVGLRLLAGTTLRFRPGDYLLARGPLDFRGSARSNVVLEGVDGAGWGGLVAVGDLERHWTHVAVRGTRGIERGDWRVPAGVTFRRGAVRLAHTTFDGSEAGAALQLDECVFAIESTVFGLTRHDALVSIRGSGEVRSGGFVDIAGVALRVEGGQLEAYALRFERVGEALLAARASVGAGDLTVHDAQSGITSVDGAEVHLRDAVLDGIAGNGLRAYRRGDAHRPALLRAERVQITARGAPASAEGDSLLILEGAPIAPDPGAH